MPKIGLIGGSGLYNMEGLTVNEKREIDTPFGKPSGPYMLGQIDGVDVVFLPRHGPGHFHLPTEVNVRANIWGMKKLGVEWIISVSAVGSLQEDIAPGKVVLVDQFIDRSHHRRRTFFGEGTLLMCAIARVAAHEGAHPQADAMQHAVMTAEHLIPNATRHKLAPVTSKYYPPQEGEFEGEMPTVPEPASFSSSSSSSSGVDVQTIGIAAAVAMSALALAKSFNLV
ncbi:hypothetical protein PTSG_07783 [Salpingoeca rosetta]|uniref:Nucleoside phosphorylase domain-containing protein n=1 Tax=Salpingoeca rosetta (strain ATCC 50818 / BSB-021) TaxID=946362 RepID=F2UGB4_SALR5|nr:uncharacterized protein PTSG_07783 [Salpingoeca rosetta]EGD75664.1 hypothetical protein PTSG_07783 [Salpingoeca rosetta]|eukprot:XP_004991585.1 hypothetical protein PTSG_07783 [Salpingoeca rosetta]